MKLIFAILLFSILGVTMTGCHRDVVVVPMLVDVNSALKLSGDNRGELQKVLDYYRKEKPDLLKLKAAEYLISNMVAHYAVAGETMDRLKRDIDTTLRDQPNAVKLMFYLMAARVAIAQGGNTVEYDLHKITSDYLIRNIEQSFVIWENIQNHYDLSCEDFFKYILPYRINNEPLIEWKDSAYYHLYNFDKGDQLGFSLGGYQGYISAKIPTYYRYEKFKEQFSDSLLRMYEADCIDRAYSTQIINRIFGIPTAVDFVPHYPTRENRHYWTILRDHRYVNSKCYYSYTPYTAKVYRKTSFINPIPEDKDNFIPHFIRDPYKIDVTEEYENAVDLNYTFKTFKSNTRYGYLCVFNNLAWNEVAWSEMRGGKVMFEKIGRDIMYMPCYYDGKHQVFADYPLWVRSNGEVEPLVPDKKRLQKLRLNRKFTYNPSGDYNGAAIIGVQLHATNDLSKEPYDSIAVIRHYNYMAYDTLCVNTTKKYKFWMVKKVNYNNPAFASIKFMQDGEALTAKSTFTINLTGKMDKNERLSRNIFNDDLLDFGALSKIAGVEFKEPVSVDVVKYITQNDKNGVYPGDTYELLYFDQGEWVSLGRKVATADYIEYDDVPSGALYWLRNRTECKEERPFTVMNGRVRFW